MDLVHLVFLSQFGSFYIVNQQFYSLQIFFSQPIVVIPVCEDQPINAKESERIGFGISHPYADLNEKGLYKDLKEVLENPKYSENAKKHGAMLNDQINKPLDRQVKLSVQNSITRWCMYISQLKSVFQVVPSHRVLWDVLTPPNF